MDTLACKLRALLCAIALVAASFSSSGHEDATARQGDNARNHLVAETMPAVYFIRLSGMMSDTETRAPRSGTIHFGIGTGFGVTQNGMILTKMHVVNPHYGKVPSKLVAPNTFAYANGVTITVTIELSKKDGTKHTATIIGGDPNDEEDLALLQIANTGQTNYPFLELADEMSLYDSVITIGNPYGVPFTVAEGIVSNPDAVFSGKHLVQTTALMIPGSSGGPIIRMRDHKVIGMSESTYAIYEGMPVSLGFGTPSIFLIKFLKLHSSGKKH